MAAPVVSSKLMDTLGLLQVLSGHSSWVVMLMPLKVALTQFWADEPRRAWLMRWVREVRTRIAQGLALLLASSLSVLGTLVSTLILVLQDAEMGGRHVWSVVE